MNTADAARLLTAAALYDNRKVDDLAAIAWSKALGPHVNYADALEAISAHYGATSDWLMPAHVNQRVSAMRRARVEHKTPPPPPASIDPADVGAQMTWTRTVTRYIADGHDEATAAEMTRIEMGLLAVEGEPRPVAQLVAQVEQSLPRIPRRDVA